MGLGMVDVHIVTDSTAYLPEEVLREFPHLHVVSLTVHFPHLVMEDGLENLDSFLRELKASPRPATTSQPPPQRFAEVFRPLVEEGHEIVAILISSVLSGTCTSAQAAADAVGPERIEIIDSRLTTAPMAFAAIQAARAAQAGKSRREIVDLVHWVCQRSRLFFVPDTLEYLHKGGRIGGAQALLGSLLQIKPILYLVDGRVEVLDKVRTRSRAMQRLVEELPGDHQGYEIAVLHLDGLDNALTLKGLVQERLGGREVPVIVAGPVLGTHVGPGAFGLMICQRPPEAMVSGGSNIA